MGVATKGCEGEKKIDYIKCTKHTQQCSVREIYNSLCFTKFTEDISCADEHTPLMRSKTHVDS